jgi:TonB family protein
LVASAANTIPAQDGSTAEPARPSVRPNPVALEVAVVATGTRPSDAPGQRDLFTEETTTVLVFRDGAVIRLNAAVALGQLVFLTNKQTKREVVCQVLRKRRLGPTGCYVELDFTEEMAGFWGVQFPAEEAAQPKKAFVAPTAAVAAAEEMVESAGVGSGEASAIPAAPSLQEVDQLREEVELLRQQLQSLLQAQEPAQTEGASRTEEPGTRRSEAPAWAKAVTDAMLSGVGQQNQKAEVMAANEPAPEAEQQSRKPEVATGPAPVNPPARRAPFAEEEEAIADLEGANAEELLPKPAQDLAKAAKSPKKNESSAGAGKSEARSGVVVKTAVVLVFLTVGGAVAWYENLLPFLPGTKAIHPISLVAEPARSGAITNGGVAVTNANVASKPADAPVANAKLVDIATGKSADAAPGTIANTQSDESITKGAADTEKSAGSGHGKKSLRGVANVEPETELPESAMNDSGVVPAKLLKSVNAVYPPDAMRNYITGDVIIDALVHANGRVGEMKVLTGPTALRDAAIDALKQYEYAPATQGGKQVASHVKVTVKFWFNP